MTIIEAIEDKRFFRPLFKDLSTWHSWLIFLRVLFGLPIEERKDRRLFRQCTGLKRPPGKPAKESFVIAGRRSGKSFISSIISVYLACFKDWKPYLSAGEKGWIFIIATDREQAKIIKNYISGILNSNPIFQRMIKKELVWEIELSNNVNIAIKTCSFKSVRGYTVLAAICEELAFWRDENSANPAQEILTALRPALATIPESLLIGISTPYSRSGLLWEQYHAYFGSNEKGIPLLWRSPSSRMNPTIPKKEIERAYIQDRSAARAEWDAEFRDDLESFLPIELIDGAVVPNRIELPPISDVGYCAFTDVSGGRHDSFCTAISHRDGNGKIVLDLVREARPPFAPRDVTQELCRVLKRYGIGVVVGDRYSAEWAASAFRENDIVYEPSELTASEIYINSLPLFSNHQIELLDNKRLYGQLRALERRVRSGGKDVVSHLPGLHDDVANSAIGAIVLSHSQASDVEFLNILEETTRRHYESAAEDALTDEEKLDRRMMKWLLGGELEPPRDQNDESVNEGRKTYTIKIEKIK